MIIRLVVPLSRTALVTDSVNEPDDIASGPCQCCSGDHKWPTVSTPAAVKARLKKHLPFFMVHDGETYYVSRGGMASAMDPETEKYSRCVGAARMIIEKKPKPEGIGVEIHPL